MKKLLPLLLCMLFSAAAFAQKPFTFNVNGKRYTYTAAQVKGQVQSLIRQRMKGINEQLPLQVDEMTTLQAVLYIGNSLQCSYKIDIDKSEFTQEEIGDIVEETKELVKQNLKACILSFGNQLPPKEWKRLFVVSGIYFKYLCYDRNGVLIANYSFYPKDIDID